MTHRGSSPPPGVGYRRALARDGRYLIVGGELGALPRERVLTIVAAIGALTGRRLGLLAVKQGPQHFAPPAARCASREVRIHIDRVFPFAQVPEALASIGEGRAWLRRRSCAG